MPQKYSLKEVANYGYWEGRTYKKLDDGNVTDIIDKIGYLNLEKTLENLQIEVPCMCDIDNENENCYICMEYDELKDLEFYKELQPIHIFNFLNKHDLNNY